jgi:hypothetical protein
MTKKYDLSLSMYLYSNKNLFEFVALVGLIAMLAEEQRNRLAFEVRTYVKKHI